MSKIKIQATLSVSQFEGDDDNGDEDEIEVRWRHSGSVPVVVAVSLYTICKSWHQVEEASRTLYLKRNKRASYKICSTQQNIHSITLPFKELTKEV